MKATRSGSVKVPEGVTLTVEPGTHIHFEKLVTGDDAIDAEYYPFMEVHGSAMFEGTAEQPIRLTTDSTLAILGPNVDGNGGYEILYKSGLIEAGNHIQKVTLSRGLAEGTYNAVIFVQPYRMDGVTPTNNAETEVVLIVK